MVVPRFPQVSASAYRLAYRSSSIVWFLLASMVSLSNPFETPAVFGDDFILVEGVLCDHSFKVGRAERETKTSLHNVSNEAAGSWHGFMIRSILSPFFCMLEFYTSVRLVHLFTYYLNRILVTGPAHNNGCPRWEPKRKSKFSSQGQTLLNDYRHRKYLISTPDLRAETERNFYLRAACS